MKNIPPNAWRNRLNETDWNFARCPSDELRWCWKWELHRERAQAEADGVLLTSPLNSVPTTQELFIANAWGERHPDKHISQIAKMPKGWIYHPHFPQLSYLDSRTKEGWKRINNEPTPSHDWLELGSNAWRELENHIREVGESPVWRSSNDNTEIVPLIIQWNWRDEDIIEAFRQWLKEHRPKGDGWDDRPRVDEPPPRPKKKGGAGDPIRQAKVKLKALGAWRLIQHYNGDNFVAFDHPGAAKYLGRQFDMPGAWSEARATVRKALKELKEFRFYPF